MQHAETALLVEQLIYAIIMCGFLITFVILIHRDKDMPKELNFKKIAHRAGIFICCLALIRSIDLRGAYGIFKYQTWYFLGNLSTTIYAIVAFYYVYFSLQALAGTTLVLLPKWILIFVRSISIFLIVMNIVNCITCLVFSLLIMFYASALTFCSILIVHNVVSYRLFAEIKEANIKFSQHASFAKLNQTRWFVTILLTAKLIFDIWHSTSPSIYTTKRNTYDISITPNYLLEFLAISLIAYVSWIPICTSEQGGRNELSILTVKTKSEQKEESIPLDQLPESSRVQTKEQISIRLEIPESSTEKEESIPLEVPDSSISVKEQGVVEIPETAFFTPKDLGYIVPLDTSNPPLEDETGEKEKEER